MIYSPGVLMKARQKIADYEQDCYDIEGINTNAGLVSWLPYKAQKNSSVAQGLLNAGAILYAKTSSSQALLMVESINNIFGTVKNPYNLALSAGGSSGGEACLVAARGSILGSGSDGGGSLRFPAAHCGTCKYSTRLVEFSEDAKIK
jgi:amidase